MYWYRFELTEDQIGKGGLGRMERQFEEYIALQGEWKSACLLRKWQPYDTEAVFYIYATNPMGEETLSRLFSARPCDAPSISSVRFWSGDIGLNESLKTASSR